MQCCGPPHWPKGQCGGRVPTLAQGTVWGRVPTLAQGAIAPEQVCQYQAGMADPFLVVLKLKSESGTPFKERASIELYRAL